MALIVPLKTPPRRRGPSGRIWPFLLAILLQWSCCGQAWAESEATVKAAYLLNFAKLVEWPASAFTAGQPLVLGVVGREGMAEELARVFAGASANGRSIEVRRVSAGDAGALLACHVVFVADGERGESVIVSVQGRPVLVVGEAENFARRGAALGFVKEAGSLKFEANPKAAARNGLTVSAKLLRVARGVISN